MKKTFILSVALCAAGAMQAQEAQDEQRFWRTESEYYSSGVNNEGEVVVFSGQCEPYEIWIPKTGDTFVIGGISGGNGIGGLGRFSDDGMLVSAVRYNDNVKVEKAWTKNTLEDKAYRFNSISFPSTYCMLAAGSTKDGQKGYVLKSVDQGATWKPLNLHVFEFGSEAGIPDLAGGVECLYIPGGVASITGGLMGGHNGTMYNIKPNGTCTRVDIHPEGNTDEVKTYWAVDFLEADVNGVYNYATVGLELADGTGAVWYSEDNASTFSEATGVKGVPVCITHNGSTYFMTTRDGMIQKSADNGKTWQTVFELSGGISPFSLDNESPLEGIRFSDENNGIATGVGCIYVTADGGDTWEKREIKAANNLTVWNDVAYVDGNIVIVGSDGNICSSEDGGTTWTLEYIDGETTNELSCAFVTSEGLTIGGSESTILHKGTADIKHAYNAAVYNMESETWTDMEHSGYFSGLGDPDPIEAGSASTAEDISGDGSTVVGIVQNFKKYNDESAIHGEAAAWVNGKLNILGSKFADRNRASKATKASYDGSVIVGWQDIMGPWYGQVWTKNATGGYDRKMVFVDDKMTEDDITEWPMGGLEAMQQYGETFVGLCNAVSSDGKWIGGRGGGNWYTGIGGAWLRNLETGETKTITNDDDMVYDMTNDASFVVGQAGPGMSPWIWTEETGKKEMNDYVTTDLGIDLGNFIICGVMDLSPNGRYICGWGMEGEGKFAYMVDLKGNVQSSIEKDLEQTKAAVYPNPVADELHIDLPFSEVTTHISLYDMQGAMVKTMTVNSQNNIMNVADVHPGLYILNVNANGTKKSFKLQIKH